jgi:transglutaminase-like putative cysteine protease
MNLLVENNDATGFGAITADAAGINFQRESYPEGEEGIQKSLRAICQKVREGAPTPVMRSFAGNILRQAGFPRTNRDKASVLCNYVKQNVGYVHDPPGTELIQSAAVTLCVDGAPVCIPIGDCDDEVTALMTLCAAAGMEVEAVRQFFGAQHQQHVLCEAKMEDGSWFPLDATALKLPPGKKAHATKETRMSPWASSDITGLSDQAEFIGIGALPVMGLGADGRYHHLASEVALGTSEPIEWYEISPGVEASRPIIKPLQIKKQEAVAPVSALPIQFPGLGLGEDLASMLPKMSNGKAVLVGAGIVAASVGVAVVIRRMMK